MKLFINTIYCAGQSGYLLSPFFFIVVVAAAVLIKYNYGK